MTTLFYDPRSNRFLNSRGGVINTTTLFDTWKLDAWKKSGEFIDYIIAKDGNIWELFYMTQTLPKMMKSMWTGPEVLSLKEYYNWRSKYVTG